MTTDCRRIVTITVGWFQFIMWRDLHFNSWCPWRDWHPPHKWHQSWFVAEGYQTKGKEWTFYTGPFTLSWDSLNVSRSRRHIRVEWGHAHTRNSKP